LNPFAERAFDFHVVFLLSIAYKAIVSYLLPLKISIKNYYKSKNNCKNKNNEK